MLPTQKFNDAPKPLKDFLFYMLTIRGRSPKTVEAYYIDIRTFLRYIKYTTEGGGGLTFTEITIEDITIEKIRNVTLSDIYGFLNFTFSERGNIDKTRARKISSLRSFFTFLTSKEHLLEENPVKNLESPRVKRALPRHLNLEESLDLIQNINSTNTQRDLCIIVFFLNCGMRLAELIGINLEDISENSVRLLGKGSKERVVYLNDACLYALEQYLLVRRHPIKKGEKNALFLSARGKRISRSRVQQIVDDAMRAAGLGDKGYSPHKLRHTAATLMYQHGGVDIRVLKEILGHTNLATTEIYTHVSNQQIEEAAAKSPLSGIKIKSKK